MKIKVTKSHIDNAYKGSNRCPIALAVLEATKVHDTQVAVTRRSLYIAGKVYWLSHEMYQFVATFDKTGPSHVAPFEFDTDLLTQTNCGTGSY